MQAFAFQDNIYGQGNNKTVITINNTDWHLLSYMRNSFEVTGLQLVKANFPDIQFHITGSYNPDLIKERLELWRMQAGPHGG
jgi:hypothetical protein